MEQGYGSPSSMGAQGNVDGQGVLVPFDWGYGSPSALDGGDTGYGAPWSDEALSMGVYVLHPTGALPDDGGVIVELGGSWESVPHLVRLRATSGAAFPPGRTCHGGVAGRGVDVVPVFGGAVLRFVLPPCPPGRYDIEITYGGVVVTVPGAIRVQRRLRPGAIYRLRANLTALFAAGPRHAGEETLLPGGAT